MVSRNPRSCSSCFTIILSVMSNCLRFGKIFILVNVASGFLRKRTLRFVCRNFGESEFGKSTWEEWGEQDWAEQVELNCDFCYRVSAILGWPAELSLQTRVPSLSAILSILIYPSLDVGCRLLPHRSLDFGQDDFLWLWEISGEEFRWEQSTYPVSGGTIGWSWREIWANHIYKIVLITIEWSFLYKRIKQVEFSLLLVEGKHDKNRITEEKFKLVFFLERVPQRLQEGWYQEHRSGNPRSGNLVTLKV